MVVHTYSSVQIGIGEARVKYCSTVTSYIIIATYLEHTIFAQALVIVQITCSNTHGMLNMKRKQYAPAAYAYQRMMSGSSLIAYEQIVLRLRVWLIPWFCNATTFDL